MPPLLPALVVAFSVLAWTPAQAQDAAADLKLAQASGAIAWRSLTSEQQAALQPLGKLWASMGADQQRKWVALTHNFNRLSPQERTTLQSRMTEWARLTPAQRQQARLNFGELRQLPADERRAKWEEYQALPIEERERLARDRPKPPTGAAPALKPAAPDRLLRPTQPPAPFTTPVAPGPVDGATPAPGVHRHTLLPQPPAPAPDAPR